MLGPLSAALGSCLLWQSGEAAAARPRRRAGRRGAAERDAAVRRRRGDHDARYAAAVLLGLRLVGAGLFRAARPQRLVVVAAGVFAGLALASKYTAALLRRAASPVVAGRRRRCAAGCCDPAPGGARCRGAVFVPVMGGTGARTGRASPSRAAAWATGIPARAAQFLGELTGGQIGLATPLVFVLCVAGMVLAARLAWRRARPGLDAARGADRAALCCIRAARAGRPRAGQLAGNRLSGRRDRRGRAGTDQFGGVCRAPAVALGLAITLLVYVQAVAAPFALPARIDPTALRLGGWSGLAAQVEAARTRVSARFVAADEYGLSAELAWLIPGTRVIGVGARWTLFDLPRPQTAGQVRILVRSERRGGDIDRAPWADIQEIGEAVRQRDGLVMERYRLFRVVARRQNTGEAVLPGRHGNNPSLAQGVVAPSGRG